jgi:hypothetical protein
MDDAEQTAKKYLETQAFTDIVYEPDGNIPPDFLCDKKIAIEVRRLNLSEVRNDGSFKGLEETQIPLYQKMCNLFKQLGPPEANHSWFVFYTFERPIKRWKELESILRERLEKFKHSTKLDRNIIQITDTFEIELFKASKVIDNQFFFQGGYSDEDTGCFLLSEMEKSINLVLDEKTRKVSSVKHKYPEWWLILIDHIGFGLDDFDRLIFHDQVKIKHGWDKVILLDPRNALRSFEIISAH